MKQSNPASLNGVDITKEPTHNLVKQKLSPSIIKGISKLYQDRHIIAKKVLNSWSNRSFESPLKEIIKRVTSTGREEDSITMQKSASLPKSVESDVTEIDLDDNIRTSNKVTTLVNSGATSTSSLDQNSIIVDEVIDEFCC